MARRLRHILRQHYGGWSPSRPDQRDRIADPRGLTVLPEVDPRWRMPAVFDQQQLGSCTANAVAACFEYDNHIDGTAYTRHRPSRLFIYYCERLIEGSLGQGDTGAYGRDGFKALAKYGVPPERDWLYHIDQYEADPPDSVWAEAVTWKLAKPYAAVQQDEAHWKAILSNDQTIAFGFTVYSSFEDPMTEQSGIVPMPQRSEQQMGGHEMLAVGYLAAYPDHVLCRNSWGKNIYQGLDGATSHGGGYCLLPWSYVLNSSLSSDARTIVRAI